MHGYKFSQLDPLNLFNQQPASTYHQQFGYKNGTDALLQSVQKINVLNIGQLQTKLKQIYAGKSSVQFAHIQQNEKDWLYSKYEQKKQQIVNEAEKRNNLQLLYQTQAFDHFLGRKFVTFKRYSGEGAQGVITGMKTLFTQLSKKGIQHIVMGIPHRGRLNILTSLLQYPPRLLFRKISGKCDTPAQLYTIIDDVVSHISVSTKKQLIIGNNKKMINLTIVHNPSHLQSQNSVSLGKAKAKANDFGQQKVINVQLHGDSAFSGQGIVYESLLLSKLRNYNANGTIHIVVNNQLGYTTYPKDSRSSKQCTDIAKAFGIPIIHANGDCPESIQKAVKVAVQYRQKYRKDFLINIVCYRKFGHNQVDQPSFTQPLMYNQIRAKKSTPQIYLQQLIQQKIKQGKSQNFKEFSQKVVKKSNQFLQKEFIQSIQMNITKQMVQQQSFKGNKWLTSKWKNMKPSQDGSQPKFTGIEITKCKQYLLKSVQLPENFKVHPKILKHHIQSRKQQINENKLTWATCQAIAFFSLSDQGYGIRMTGQDVQRGTFSQRHAVVTDQTNQNQFSFLQHFNKNKLTQIKNSPLSEYSVLAYQYGFSLQNPNNLVIWQAQFGDFFNTAQVVVDTFITNSQAKWLRQTGLVMILPHGFDNMGPQHSSCRIQRFLQMAHTQGSLSQNKLKKKQNRKYMQEDGIFYQNHQDANFHLCFPTTPANYFHLLRRQMKRDYRKPLIIAGPKILLRLNKCTSTFEKIGPDTSFQQIVQYSFGKQKIILSAGKYVYQINNQISKNIALYSIQQLFPFPQQLLKKELQKYSKDCQIYWVQQQPLNQGGFLFVKPRIERIMKQLNFSKSLIYIGRQSCPAVAVGNSTLYKTQSQMIIDKLKKI